MNERQDKIINFAPWLKYYDTIYSLMRQMMAQIMGGEFESALKTAILWHDSLDFTDDPKCKFIEKNYQENLKKAKKTLETSKKTEYMSNNNKIDKIEEELMNLHSIIQRGMYIKGMKYTEKILPPDSFDEAEFLEASGL